LHNNVGLDPSTLWLLDDHGLGRKEPNILIDFTDGRRWSSADIGDFRASVDPALAIFLEQKTQLPLDHAQREVDIPQRSTQR